MKRTHPDRTNPATSRQFDAEFDVEFDAEADVQANVQVRAQSWLRMFSKTLGSQRRWETGCGAYRTISVIAMAAVSPACRFARSVVVV
jgi:hypothetical protein